MKNLLYVLDDYGVCFVDELVKKLAMIDVGESFIAG